MTGREYCPKFSLQAVEMRWKFNRTEQEVLIRPYFSKAPSLAQPRIMTFTDIMLYSLLRFTRWRDFMLLNTSLDSY